MTKDIAKRGRPPKQPPKDAAALIHALAADGFSMRGVAARVGVSLDTFLKWLEQFPALKEAFDDGREAERYALHNMLYRQAMDKGNATAAMFLLKARHGYREGENSESGNKVQINFSMPGALSMDDFTKQKVIDHGSPNNRDQSISAEYTVITGSN